MTRPHGPMHTWPPEAVRAYKAACMRYARGKGPHPGIPRPRHRSLRNALSPHVRDWEAVESVPFATLTGYQGA